MKSAYLLIGLLFLMGFSFAGGILDIIFGPSETVGAEAAPEIQSEETVGIEPIMYAPGEPVPVSTGDELEQIISLLEEVVGSVSQIAANTAPAGETVEAGNIVLFDNNGNWDYRTNQGTNVVALPAGKCEVALYGGHATETEFYELKEFGHSLEYRNKQTCDASFVCRKTVTLDSEYPFLYVKFNEAEFRTTLEQVTLSYRCVVKKGLEESSSTE